MLDGKMTWLKKAHRAKLETNDNVWGTNAMTDSAFLNQNEVGARFDYVGREMLAVDQDVENMYNVVVDAVQLLIGATG